MMGRTLSHYRIVEEISRGGMGVVYRALDERLNREVALKVLPDDLVADPDRRRRFIQEAQAASALEHPHIAVIHEIDEAEGVTFIAMELIRGEKLGDLLQARRLTPLRAIELAIELAEGLARAHEKGIIHRDLKPANVMVSDGHVKIIDFGLAKLTEPQAGAGGRDDTRLHEGTGAGVVLGTVGYMSPEQAAGAPVDHRSDIFSFGVLLHELITGQRPFHGRTSVDTLHAIINAPAPRVQGVEAGASPDALRRAQDVLDKCLARDPDDRYQGMRDLIVDLRAVRRMLESGSGISAAQDSTEGGAVPGAAVAPGRDGRPASVPRLGSRGGRGRLLAGALLVIAVAAAAAVLVLRERSPGGPSAPASRPSVAVLYFENNTGDPSLDWMRAGLTDMLVTDLSQTPDVDVLSTDRLHRILTELRRADDRTLSADVVDEVARRAGAQAVLLGSYVKAGDTMRINVKLQEPGTGRILAAERAEGVGDESLFAIVDELTRRIKARVLPRPADEPVRALFRPAGSDGAAKLDRLLTDVTTSSIEAYRYYAEGMDLHFRFKEEAALPLFLRAVEIDPGFAMALARTAVVLSNLQRLKESEEYAARALEHADRLTTRERLYIEGVYYSRRAETMDRAIEAYRKAIELYPNHEAARQNLAGLYLTLGREDEAIEHGEHLRQMGGTFPGIYSQLANAYALRGDYTRANEVHQEFLRRFPDSASGHLNLAGTLTAWGKVDEALEAYARAEALGARRVMSLYGRFNVVLLQGRWAEADDLAGQLTGLTDAFSKMVGWAGSGMVAAYGGRSLEALEKIDQALRVGQPPLIGVIGGLKTRLLMERRDFSAAMTAAERSRRDSRGDAREWQALRLIGLIQAQTGRTAEAQKTLAELREAAQRVPGPAVALAADTLDGELALQRGDTGAALEGLTRAAAAVRPMESVGPPSDNPAVWFALARAHFTAGNRDQAAEWFGRVVDSRLDRIFTPIEYVQSLYFLGRLAETRGERQKAHDFFRRYLDHWGRGDIDRARVAEVRQKLG